MRNAAVDLGPQGIRVNTVHPGAVPTPMADNPVSRAYFADLPAEGSHFGNALPVQFVQPEDLSNACLYLCSDAGRYVTGVTLAVDAGFVVKG
jgi:NAD(P)-dependent dehydrogenase (short-subunit alcohol dehydrogenase family)